MIVVAGPTATGKTELAIRLGEALRARGRPAEIISADSRQVFRGLDIGTAKVSVTDRARVPHHGIDLVYPDQPFSVADFVARTRAVLNDLASQGAVAILAGGTGLYLRAIARGLDTDALPSDPRLRARLEAELTADGLLASVERLEGLAPVLATGVDLRNPRRVVRALEIAELRGDGPPPALQPYPGPLVWLGLSIRPHVYFDRIKARAHAQFQAGLIEEARELRERFDPSLPAFSAIGYREAWSVLDGELTEAAAIDLDIQRNQAFSKRQRTWFRSEPGITWLDATAALPVEAALEKAGKILAAPRIIDASDAAGIKRPE
jgi:tRNA dimethylallyltransferase